MHSFVEADCMTSFKESIILGILLSIFTWDEIINPHMNSITPQLDPVSLVSVNCQFTHSLPIWYKYDKL